MLNCTAPAARGSQPAASCQGSTVRHPPVPLVNAVGGGQHAVHQLRVGAAHLRGGAARQGCGSRRACIEGRRVSGFSQCGGPHQEQPCRCAAGLLFPAGAATTLEVEFRSSPAASSQLPLPTFSTRCGSSEGQRAGKSCEEMMERASLSWARTRGGVDSIRSVMCAFTWSCTRVDACKCGVCRCGWCSNMCGLRAFRGCRWRSSCLHEEGGQSWAHGRCSGCCTAACTPRRSPMHPTAALSSSNRCQRRRAAAVAAASGPPRAAAAAPCLLAFSPSGMAIGAAPRPSLSRGAQWYLTKFLKLTAAAWRTSTGTLSSMISCRGLREVAQWAGVAGGVAARRQRRSI